MNIEFILAEKTEIPLVFSDVLDNQFFVKDDCLYQKTDYNKVLA